jgi:hypothetical protein
MVLMGSERFDLRQPGHDLRYSKRAARDGRIAELIATDAVSNVVCLPCCAG